MPCIQYCSRDISTAQNTTVPQSFSHHTRANMTNLVNAACVYLAALIIFAEVCKWAVVRYQDPFRILEPFAGRHPDKAFGNSKHGLTSARDACDLVSVHGHHKTFHPRVL